MRCFIPPAPPSPAASGICPEDLLVLPELRSRGFGIRLLTEIAALTVQRGYARRA